MKILSSEVSFSSEHQHEQLDLSLNEKKTRTLSPSFRQRVSSQRADVATRMVDRVSFSRDQNHEFQSNYTADVSSTATVTSAQADGEVEQTLVSYEQKNAMEKLVGGVINREVVINAIASGSDIVLRDQDAIALNENPKNESLNNFQGRTSQEDSWEISTTQTDIYFEQEQMMMSSVGNVTTEDGRQIDFSLDMSLNRAFVSRTQEQTLSKRWREEVSLIDPLVISFDGNAPTLSDVQFAFDLDSDGTKELVSFVNAGSGFLAFDQNDDQVINDGSELFGPGTGNGFEELAAWDQDQNNWIDENDDIFTKLSVWTRDENGEDQLISLKDAGVGAIALDYAQTQFNMTASDNTLQGQMKSTGVFLFENGNIGAVSQVDLASVPIESLEPVQFIDQQRLDPFPGLFEPVGAVGFNVQDLSLVTVVPSEAPEQVAEKPLKALLDRIEELKAEIGSLFEKRSLAKQELVSKKDRFSRFQTTTIHPSILPSRYMSRPGRFQGRFI